MWPRSPPRAPSQLPAQHLPHPPHLHQEDHAHRRRHRSGSQRQLQQTGSGSMKRDGVSPWFSAPPHPGSSPTGLLQPWDHERVFWCTMCGWVEGTSQALCRLNDCTSPVLSNHPQLGNQTKSASWKYKVRHGREQQNLFSSHNSSDLLKYVCS